MKLRLAAVLLLQQLSLAWGQSAPPADLITGSARGVMGFADCEVVPVGEHRGSPEGASKSPPLDRLIKLQIVQIARIAGSSDRYIVNLHPSVDRKMVRLLAGTACYRTRDYMNTDVSVVRIDAVKGGKTNWEGSIAYVIVASGKRTIAADDEPTEPTRLRLLFKLSPFEKDWRFVIGDIAYRNGQFQSDNVPVKLQQD
jgi:hypothetical protein